MVAELSLQTQAMRGQESHPGQRGAQRVADASVKAPESDRTRTRIIIRRIQEEEINSRGAT